MGFTYTDKAGKIILHSWGRFRAVVLAAVEVGDLLNRYATTNSSAIQLADSTGSLAASAVACQDGDAGEEIWCCLAAEVKAPPTVGTGGVVTPVYFAAEADFLGTALYLGDAGKASSSAGVLTQLVGWLLSRDRILLTPGGGILTGAGAFSTISASGAVALSDALTVTGATALNGGLTMDTDKFTVEDDTGNTGIAGTLAVTGVVTLSAVPVCSAGVSIAANKTLVMAVTDNPADAAVTPKGMQTLSKGSAGAYTLAAPTAGEICVIAAKTAQAHVVTTAAGVTYDGTNNTATFGGAIGDCIVLVGISATRWQELSNTNVTLSSV